VTTIQGFGLVNTSKDVSADQLAAMVVALQVQLRRDVPALWNTPADLQVTSFAAVGSVPDGWWPILLTDASDEPDDLGYHADDSGRVYSQIQVGVIVGGGGAILDASKGGASVSTVTSHEMLETLMDSQTNLWLPYPNAGKPSTVAYEVCDPVQGSSYAINVSLPPAAAQDVWVSNFVTPQWFDADATAGASFDFLGTLRSPFTLGPGGYIVLQDGAGNTSDVWGDRRPPEWRLRASSRRLRRHVRG
jgi:hypothetical protein